jgi:molybdenum cofactor cytidylyltransferase
LALNFTRAGASTLALIGAEADRVREHHPDLPLVEDAAWTEGPWAQMRHGVEAALQEEADWVLVQPVDMPAVRTNTLKAMLQTLAGNTHVDGVRPSFEGAAGFPLLLTRSAAERLRASSAPSLDAALKGLQLKELPSKDPGVVVRISARDAYERVFGEAPKLAPPPKRRARKASA